MINIVLFRKSIDNMLTKFDVFAQRKVALNWLLFEKAISKHIRFYSNLGLNHEFVAT